MTNTTLTHPELTKIIITEDCIHYPKWFQELGYDADATAKELLALTFADRQSPWMKYRGNPIKRDKAFFVDSLERVPIYSFPGFQYRAVVEEYQDFKSAPIVESLRYAVTKVHGHVTNHGIATSYKDETDTIGWHNDKPKSLDPKVPIIMMNFLAQRPLAFRPNPTVDCKDPAIVCEVPNAHGSLTIMGHHTNTHYQHAVLPGQEKCGQRISVILRGVSNIIPMEQVRKLAKV